MTSKQPKTPGFFRLHPEVLGLAAVLAVLTLTMPDGAQASFTGNRLFMDCAVSGDAGADWFLFGRSRSALDTLQERVDSPNAECRRQLRSRIQQQLRDQKTMKQELQNRLKDRMRALRTRGNWVRVELI